jgi:ribosome biogenesis GTPase
MPLSKKKKVRVELRKNRQKRRRANDLTRRFQEGEPTGAEPVSDERVRAKGELSRKRTIIVNEPAVAEPGSTDPAPESDHPAASLAIDLDACLTGRVIRIHGLESIVQVDDGRTFRCGIRRLLKTLAIDGRNVVAVGDEVYFRPWGDDQGLIEKVQPRHGAITRGYRRREHVIVSNIDRLLIVCAFDDPPLKPALIDRYLISAEKGGVRPYIVLNKADLIDLADYQWILGLYNQLGYETIPTSVKDGRGIDRIREIIGQGTTALSGQSGVGKSSLLNMVEPGLNLRVGAVSDWTSKGRHTTTTAELIRLAHGGYVVDTPGLRQFELWDVEPFELERYFVEFRAFVPRCRFPDCSHTHEHSCAVKTGLEFGMIDEGRFESYLKLYHGQPLEGEGS